MDADGGDSKAVVILSVESVDTLWEVGRVCEVGGEICRAELFRTGRRPLCPACQFSFYMAFMSLGRRGCLPCPL
jgi:hypothetical protein